MTANKYFHLLIDVHSPDINAFKQNYYAKG